MTLEEKLALAIETLERIARGSDRYEMSQDAISTLDLLKPERDWSDVEGLASDGTPL